MDLDELELETWCPVCDKLIPQQAAASYSDASTSSSAAGGASTNPAESRAKRPPSKFIIPMAPTFKRGKTGTIKSKQSTAAAAAAAATVAANMSSAGVGPAQVAGPSGAGFVAPPATGPGPATSPTTTATKPPPTTAVAAGTATAVGRTPAHNFTRASSQRKTAKGNESSPSPSPAPATPAAGAQTAAASAQPQPPPAPPPAVFSSRLYCSAVCKDLDEARSLAALLSLSPPPPVISPAPALTSPFFVSDVSGGDASGDDYFGTGRPRGGSRSTHTTASSSDSLASLDDNHPQHHLGSSSSTHSHSSSNGGHTVRGAFRKMTPLHPHPPLVQVLVGGAASILSPASPRRGSTPSASSTSSSYARSATAILPGAAGLGHRASSSVHHNAHSTLHHHHHHNTPTSPGGTALPAAAFEPGSAPATASLYAAYGASFQRTPSVESRLAMYGSPRASSSFIGSYGLRGREAERRKGGSREQESSVSSSASRDRLDFTPSLHAITPSQSTLLSKSLSSRVHGGGHGANSSASSLTSSRRHSHAHSTGEPETSSSMPRSRPSFSSIASSSSSCGGGLDEDDDEDDHHRSSPRRSISSLHQRPGSRSYFPAPSSPALPAGTTTSTWSWAPTEKLYDVPRLSTTPSSAAGQGFAVSGNGGKVIGGGSGKLFYWGD